MSDLTTVQLSPEDALLFIQFQKRYAFIQLMESMGLFNLKSGSITIHLDNIGQIASVDKVQHHRV